MSSEQLEVPKLVSSCSSVDNSNEAENTRKENAVHKSKNQRSPAIKSPQPSSSASKMVRLSDRDMIDADAVPQIKTAQKMQLPLRHDGNKSRDMKEKA
uniref:Uncharacterized protein n=1 Tax=Arundo donax TaxID=35708 RepID=A0A0A9E8B3_ARUDO